MSHSIHSTNNIDDYNDTINPFPFVILLAFKPGEYDLSGIAHDIKGFFDGPDMGVWITDIPRVISGASSYTRYILMYGGTDTRPIIKEWLLNYLRRRGIPDDQYMIDDRYYYDSEGELHSPPFGHIINDIGALDNMGNPVIPVIPEIPDSERPIKSIPREATNFITYNNIADGNRMVNFHGESRFGRYYKKATYNSLPSPKKNPYTRQTIKSNNVEHYKASINGGATTSRRRRVTRVRTSAAKKTRRRRVQKQKKGSRRTYRARGGFTPYASE